MTTLYTKLLGVVSTTTAGTYLLGPVPAGVRWVITDITIWGNSSQYQFSRGIVVYAGAGSANFRMALAGPGFPWYNRAFHWSGRQAIDTGHYIIVVDNDGGREVRITGFELTLP